MSRLKLFPIIAFVFTIALPALFAEATSSESSQTQPEFPPPNATTSVQNMSGSVPLGIGMAKPPLKPEQPLYFYSQLNFNMPADFSQATDSVTFVEGEYYVDIETAPPWLLPEVLKLDYNLLYLRAVTITKNWIEVVVNRQTGMTRWIDRYAVKMLYWPDFLAAVNSVEVVDVKTNPLRLKPLAHASIVEDVTGKLLQPLAIQANWMKVGVLNDNYELTATGWIRWRDEKQLLIVYSLLS